MSKKKKTTKSKKKLTTFNKITNSTLSFARDAAIAVIATVAAEVVVHKIASKVKTV